MLFVSGVAEHHEAPQGNNNSNSNRKPIQQPDDSITSDTLSSSTRHPFSVDVDMHLYEEHYRKK